MESRPGAVQVSVRKARRAGVAAAMALSCGIAMAAASPARGTFAVGGQTLKVVDAYAFETKADFGDERTIHVRLSTRPFDRTVLDAVLDHQTEARRQGGQPYAELEFTMAGAYRGASYMVGNASCGFCGDSGAAAKSKLTAAAGVLKGTMRIAPADYKDGKGPAIDLALDLPIASAVGTTPLPANGGDPAKVLDGCRQAVKRQDAAGLARVCLAPDDPRVAEAVKYHMETRVDSVLSFFTSEGADSLTLSLLKVTGGRSKGDWAEVTIEGSGASGKSKGSVFLRRAGGSWRFDHDRLQAVY